MSKLTQELGLVIPRYKRPWSVYVLGLGLYSRHETREEGERAAQQIRFDSRGQWTTFGPVFEPATEVYDLTFGALRKDAPTPIFKPL